MGVSSVGIIVNGKSVKIVTKTGKPPKIKTKEKNGIVEVALRYSFFCIEKRIFDAETLEEIIK